MALDVSVNDKVRLTVQMKRNANTIQNVFHVNVSDVGTAANNGDFMEAAAEYIEDLYSAVNDDFTDNITWDVLIGYNETTDQPLGFATFPTFTTGLDATTALPEACCICVRAAIGFAKRYGKKYLPISTAASLDTDGHANTNTMADVLFFIGKWGSLFEDSTYGVRMTAKIRISQLGVTSYSSIQTGTANNQIDYQRRRKYGVGI